MSSSPQSVDHLFVNATVATMAGEGYGLIVDGAIGVSAGRIVWVGAAADAPVADRVEDCGGRLITPALIDCHTHLVFGGNRAREFELRLEGATYEELSRAGGGIQSTVDNTRAASQAELVEDALKRLDHLIAEGTGTVEIKSGYGLDRENELKMLRAARALSEERDVRIRTSFLGAHALPPEFADRADDYIDLVCNDMLPAAHAEGLADAVDGFCENIAFSVAQMERVFDVAADLGLSVDHLEYLSEADVKVLAEHGTVAVVLPGAFYTLRETKLPPFDALRAAGVPLAIATDANPGSSPLTSLLLTMNMACTLFRMTPEEALAGCTRNAARALGLADETGSIEAGKAADLAIWDVAEPAELAYRIGFNPLYRRIFAGRGS